MAINMIAGQALNIALPLVFLMLAAAFFILAFSLVERYTWAVFLYIPGALTAAFGVVFLLNVITNDRAAWAYAWLLLVAGTGLGVILAARERKWRTPERPWPQVVTLVGIWSAAGGVTLFALFGAIAGGLFIQVMAPILLVLGGVTLYLLRGQVHLPERFLSGGQAAPTLTADAHVPAEALSAPSTPVEPLVEPLSPRELEVLRLIDQGLSNPDIAERLVLAPSTVKSHINNIYSKLGVENRVQALRRARELGLLA